LVHTKTLLNIWAKEVILQILIFHLTILLIKILLDWIDFFTCAGFYINERKEWNIPRIITIRMFKVFSEINTIKIHF
jgi:hypothetical protein